MSASRQEVEDAGGPRQKHILRMLDVALVAASWSGAPEGRQHGCVIAGEAGKFAIAIGYNGPAAGEGYCQCADRPNGYCQLNCLAVHAEVNAVAQAARGGHGLLGAWAFGTSMPCLYCRAVLKNAGLSGAYWLVPIDVRQENDYDVEWFDEEPSLR